MVLGALIDAGLSPGKFKKTLYRLPIKGFTLDIKNVKRAGCRATKVAVKTTGRVKPRTWKDIEGIIKKSSLPKDIKQKGLSIFKRLFQAEARVHGEKFDRIHLHELGAVDCLIDIFGTLIGLDMLGVKEIYVSPLNLGGGTVKSEHGVLPVPAPATAELLKNVPVYSSDVSFELTTPTGAVLMSELADDFGPIPCMEVSKIGTGAGTRNIKKQPNILRLFVGKRVDYRLKGGKSHEDIVSLRKIKYGKKSSSRSTSFCGTEGSEDTVVLIETNIDDMNPQIYEYVMERLFQYGALDVFLTQIIMKKSRPGIKLSVLCGEDKKDGLMKIILEETTSIGVRFYEAQRKMLRRTIESIDTKFGKIRVKVSRYGDRILKITPEYEDCKRIAKRLNVPLKEALKAVDLSLKR